MTMRRSIGVVGACLLAATAAVAFSQSARAEDGPVRLASAYAGPANPVATGPRLKHVSRVKIPAASGVSYVSPPSRPRAAAVVAAVRNECFWCNAHVSGLSF